MLHQQDETDKTVFVAMPFSVKYFKIFSSVIEPACLEINARCIRIDNKSYTGDIVSEIKKEIKKCKLVIADLSESRPNVFFEIGFATGKGKPIIQICSTSLADIPFDVRNDNTIDYKLRSKTKLLNRLIFALKEIIPIP